MHRGGIMNHTQWCTTKAFPHDDAARRVADTYNLHLIGGGTSSIGHWFAARLEDGHSDNVLYSSKRDAVIHQHHNEKYYTFLKIGPNDIDVCSAAVMLKVARSLFDKGLRLADPDDRHGGKDVIKRVTIEDQMAQSRGSNTNLIMPWEAN